MARKRDLFVLSKWGYWGEELIGPLSACDKAGYEVVFVTSTGKKLKALTVSMDPSYKETSVIVDDPFITGRSTEPSYACGETLIEVLEKELRKYGFVAR